MRLTRIGERSKTRFRTSTGRHFFGHLRTPVDTTIGFTNFLSPRRLLQVGADCVLSEGEIFIDTQGTKWLIGYHGNIECRETLFKSFICYQINRTIAWKRPKESIDPVTQINARDGETSLGNLDLVMEPTKTEEDQIKIPDQQYRVLTGVDLQVDDILGEGLVVKHVEEMLLLKVASVG